MKKKLQWMLGLALATLALSVPVRAQAPEESASDNAKKAEAAVLELSKEWESWKPIADFKGDLQYQESADAEPVAVGTAKGLHADTKYGHVDVALGYIFGQEPYGFAEVAVGEWTGYLLRGEDGKLFLVARHLPTLNRDAKGEVESFTVEYVKIDGTKGTRIFTKSSKPKTKV